MLPKTSAYVKIYDGKSFGIYFLIENDDLVKKKKIHGIKSALTKLPTIKNFQSQNKILR